MSIGFWQLFILLLFIAAYFIPFIIALIRDVRNKVSVFFLNLFLGWTVIGFFVLLFYASLTNATANFGMFCRLNNYSCLTLQTTFSI